MTFVLPAARRRKPTVTASVTGKRRAQPEEQLQMVVVEYLSQALEGNSTFFAVPNGGKRNFREAQRLKAAGVRAGVPDMIVINDGRAIGIELKVGKNKPTEVQLAFHEQLKHARVPVSVCRSVDEVEAALRAAGVPLRATVEAPIIRSMRAAVTGGEG